MPFTNPLVAGTTLIRSAIKSPDYVAGTSGWQISKDGSAEFNDVTVRGALVSIGDNGSEVDIHTGATGAYIEVRPNNFGNATIDATILGSRWDGTTLFDGTNHYLLTEYRSASFSGQPYVIMEVQSASYEGTTQGVAYIANGPSDNGNIQFQVHGTTELRYGGELYNTFTVHSSSASWGSVGNIVDDQSHSFMRGESGRFTRPAWTSISTFSVAVTFTHAFANKPMVYTNMESTAAGTQGWITRAWNISTTGFTFFAGQAAGTATSTTLAIDFSWTAVENV